MIVYEGSGSPSLARQVNRRLLLGIISARGGVTRTDLARESGLSKPTINEVISDLLRAGIVTEDPAAPDERLRHPGRIPRVIRFAAAYAHVLGVDIGAAKSLLVLADVGGNVLARHRISTERYRSQRGVLTALRAGIDRVTAQAGLSLPDLHAVAVGTPGVVTPGSGQIRLAPQLPGWEGLHLAAALDPRLSCEVIVDNEVHLAVLGERWLGAAQDVDEAVLVHLGIGVGLGITLGGQLHRGVHGAAGEIGYLPISGEAPASRPPAAGGAGQFERIVSGRAFAARGRALARTKRGSMMLELAGGDPDAVDASVLFRAAQLQDPAAQQVVTEMVDHIARAVAAICLVLDPAVVIIGGGLSQAGDALLAPLAAAVTDRVPFSPAFALSQLGDEAVALGAVQLARERVIDNVLAEMERN